MSTIVSEDLENNDIETRDEHADPNQITVRHYLFSQVYSLTSMICEYFLMLYMIEF
jgi:hypothetical protein